MVLPHRTISAVKQKQKEFEAQKRKQDADQAKNDAEQKKKATEVAYATHGQLFFRVR